MKQMIRNAGLMLGGLLPLFSWAIPYDTGDLTLSYRLVPTEASPVPLDGHWIIALLLLVTTATVMRMRPESAQAASTPRLVGPSKSMLKWLLIGAVLMWALLTAGMNSTWATTNNLFNQINVKALTNYFGTQYSYTINSNYSVVIPCDQLNTISFHTIPVVNDFDVTLNARALSLIPSANATSMSNLRANVLIQSVVSTCTQTTVNVSACVNQSLAPGASCPLQVSRIPL